MASVFAASPLGSEFTPHGFCLAWQPGLLALHIVSDALIALSYYSIPLALSALLLRRRDIAFGWAMWLFGGFILACGTTHVLDIWTLWNADYALQGAVKALTAAISVLTAILLWPLVPKLAALPSPADMRRANDALAAQIREKEAVLAALRREIEERRRTEDMLRQSQKMDAVGQLTAGIAHDFNNLLMVVRGNLDVLRHRLRAQPGAGDYLDGSLEAVRRAATLTHQLLAFGRRQTLRSEALSVNARIRGLRELLTASVGGRIALTLRLDEALWRAEADPGQLDNALLNLAINAGQAMPAGGELTVETANLTVDTAAAAALAELEPGDYVRISVTDTGAGMDAATRDKAFEPFFTTKPVGTGSGLGLSQVYGFAKQSRGHVTLHSIEGAGTTVTLYLKRAGGAALPAADPRQAEPPGGLSPAAA